MAQEQSNERRLDVPDDRAWQERFWTVQRAAWVLMALFILAALFGATGKGGPLASASAATPDGTLEYPRITRWQSAEDVIVRLPDSAAGDIELLVSPKFAEVYSIDSIVPQPSQSEATSQGHLFTFDATGNGPKEIILHVTAGKPAFGRPVDVRIGRSVARVRVTVLP
jgi:hypothetical protein